MTRLWQLLPGAQRSERAKLCQLALGRQAGGAQPSWRCLWQLLGCRFRNPARVSFLLLQEALWVCLPSGETSGHSKQLLAQLSSEKWPGYEYNRSGLGPEHPRCRSLRITGSRLQYPRPPSHKGSACACCSMHPSDSR